MESRLLLLDVGNTRVKWAYVDNGRFSGAIAAYHGGDPNVVFNNIADLDVDDIWISDVTDKPKRANLEATILKRAGLQPHFAISEPSRFGLTNGYDLPERLGVDRWLMLLAVWSEIHAAFCVVSAGTALTFDAVDAGGQHLGGVIAPGLQAAQLAVLGSTTFGANSTPSIDYSDGLGVDTESCVRQGALHASAGLISRLAARQRGNAELFLSGGDASILLQHLDGHWIWRPHLVLQGLLALAIHESAS